MSSYSPSYLRPEVITRNDYDSFSYPPSPCLLNRCYKCRHSKRNKYHRVMDCRKCLNRRATAGEEHWTKVLQTKEVNYNILLRPCRDDTRNVHVEFKYQCKHCRNHRPSPTGCFNFITSVFRNISNWFSEKRHMRSSTIRYKPAHKPLARSPCKNIFRRLSSARASRRPILEPSPESSPLFLYPDQQRYLHRAERVPSNSSFQNIPDIVLFQPDHRAESMPHTTNRLINSALLSDSADSGVELNSAPRLSFCNHDMLPRLRFRLEPSGASSHTALTVTTSCPSWSGTKKLSATSRSRSWPMLGRVDFDVEPQGTDTVFNELVQYRKKLLTSDDHSLNRVSIGDCNIAYSDIEFVTCVRVGRRTMTYRGRWHGDVSIHVFNDLSKTEVADFLDLVAKMSIIRHDNIALFMGACFEPPHCIVTSVPRGASLYHQVHLSSEKMSLHTKLSIIRQIALGMGYLHARGIVLRKLNSSNIFQEPKVRICLMDHGMAEAKHDRYDRACLRRGQISYIAPEILKKLVIVPPRLIGHIKYTKESDIYAFGTVVFEVVAGIFPSLSSSSHCVIWQVCSGKRRSVTELKCVASIKNLIAECWSHNPQSRPEFHEISKGLDNTAFRKRHSSDPESINMSGYGRESFIHHIK